MAHQQRPTNQDSITRDTTVSDLSPHGLTSATSGTNSPASPPYSPFPSQTKPCTSQPLSVIQQADPSNPFRSTTVSSSTTTFSSSFATVGTPARTPSQTHPLSSCDSSNHPSSLPYSCSYPTSCSSNFSPSTAPGTTTSEPVHPCTGLSLRTRPERPTGLLEPTAKHCSCCPSRYFLHLSPF